MLDAAGKCSAAHDPRVDKKVVFLLPPIEHRDLSQRAELIPITDNHQERSRTRPPVLPIGFLIAYAVQVELIRLIDQIQSPWVVAGRKIERNDGFGFL